MKTRMTAEAALAAVRNSEDGLYGVLLQHGSMELGFYRPHEQDDQEPHSQDELYIVHRGSGVFCRGSERIPYGPGDALFVAAGVQHRFVDFSEDFSAWVVFYGPDGGESTRQQ